MSKAEREVFLEEGRVAVGAIAADGKAPLVSPVLYRYEPDGCLYFTSEASSEKAARGVVGAMATLTVESHGAWSSVYVTVEGVIESVERDDERTELRRLAERYYGPDGVDFYMSVVPDEWVMLVFAVRPTRFLTRDYRKLGLAATQ